MTFLNNENIDVFDWPPESPDCSPIEQVWALIKDSLWDQREEFETSE